MYSDITQSDGNELVASRLARLKPELRDLDFSTKTEMQAEVVGRLNKILSLGNQVSPLIRAGADGPAVVGDLTENLALLNQDAQGIVKVLEALEQDAAKLFNLTAAAQNTLRQQVREQVFCTTRKKYEEHFINATNLDGLSTASYDFGVGMATLPFVGEQQIPPSQIEIGVSSVGNLVTSLASLTDGLEETSLDWNGAQLELVFSFAKPTILNRLKISLDDYQGLNLDMLASSPDGVLREDILSELSFDSRSLDGSSNKFSGDVVLDFNPRHVKQMRIVFSDRVGSSHINLRGVSFWARRYSATGVVQSKVIQFPALGFVTFSASGDEAGQLTSITHQISFDGVQYAAIVPQQKIDLGGLKCWYRASLSRMEANFESMSVPLDKPGQDPSLSPAYTVNNVQTVDLGNSILERTINLDLMAPPTPSLETRNITLHETPLPGTFTIYQGQTLLGNESYVLRGNIIQFTGDEERPGMTITYQTSAYANAGLVARRDFYTPRLYEIGFERTF
jgi:hypothetical protein